MIHTFLSDLVWPFIGSAAIGLIVAGLAWILGGRRR